MYYKADLENVLEDANKTADAPAINITDSNEGSNSNFNFDNSVDGFGLPAGKSRTVAVILCIIGFFGLGGLHRFYVGKVGSGMVHLFSCGICGLGTIVDLISILSDRFRDNYGQLLV